MFPWNHNCWYQFLNYTSNSSLILILLPVMWHPFLSSQYPLKPMRNYWKTGENGKPLLYQIYIVNLIKFIEQICYISNTQFWPQTLFQNLKNLIKRFDSQRTLEWNSNRWKYPGRVCKKKIDIIRLFHYIATLIT